MGCSQIYTGGAELVILLGAGMIFAGGMFAGIWTMFRLDRTWWRGGRR